MSTPQDQIPQHTHDKKSEIFNRSENNVLTLSKGKYEKKTTINIKDGERECNKASKTKRTKNRKGNIQPITQWKEIYRTKKAPQALHGVNFTCLSACTIYTEPKL